MAGNEQDSVDRQFGLGVHGRVFMQYYKSHPVSCNPRDTLFRLNIRTYDWYFNLFLSIRLYVIRGQDHQA